MAEFLLESAGLKLGDELLLMGPTTGLVSQVAERIHVNNSPVDVADKGTSISVAFAGKVRPGDKLYKMVTTGYA